jgi:heavy metal translocating P-type ATPase
VPEAPRTCDLCGLSARCEPAELPSSDNPLWFCCQGCKMVYILLMEAADSPNPQSFRETELFRQCQAAGVIPRSETDLNPPRVTATTDPIAPPAGHQLDLDLRISGMWCPACAWVIETAVSRLKGVHQTSCNFSADRFHCSYDPVTTSPSRIVHAIEKLGYKAVLPGGDGYSRERKIEWIRFATSAFLTLNIMMLSFSLYGGFFTQLDPGDIQRIGWPIFGMATIVMVYGGRPIFQKAWHGLAAGSTGMEALISMGVLSAYGYSVFNLFRGSFYVYFDTATMLVTLVLLGKLIESNVRKSIQANLDAFLNLMPQKVRRCSTGFPDGRYERADRLIPGDVFILADGEIAAADGVILAGAGRIDTSSLTGEALPVSVKTGDVVLSGSKVLSGRLSIKASAIGGDSTLGQMVRLMETALGRKIPLEDRTDKILRWFVPGIFMVAIAAGFGCFAAGRSPEESLIRAITVMVISCPCALGIAIPLARVAGISLAARNGLLVRDFSALEQADRITTVAFDKTGTLTTGCWSLMDIICLGTYPESQILTYAASLEIRSHHYIAVEIRNRAQRIHVDIPDAEEIQDTGQGIEGRVEGLAVRIGSPAWAGPQGLCPGKTHEEGNGAVSRVFMRIAGQPAAIFVFGDRIRPTALESLRMLRKMGKKLAMISGDEPRAVKFVADALDIQNYRGGMSPLEKAGFIGNLCQNGEITAMVGDGVNDAPAMAGADLAIAVHSGYPLGRETAGIILMRNDPAQLPELLNLSRRVNRIINQNMYWALIYNLISIPVAVSGLLNPLVAVTAMLLSSLSVVGNTLRLTRK